MATSRVANVLETGRKEEANIAQDVSNPARDKQKFADPSGETMKALVWLGKNDVAVGMSKLYKIYQARDSPLASSWGNEVFILLIRILGITVDVPKPKIIEDTDAILKVTGTTICGSDLHLYHGAHRLYSTIFTASKYTCTFLRYSLF